MSDSDCSVSTLAWNAYRCITTRPERTYVGVWAEVVDVDGYWVSLRVALHTAPWYGTLRVEWRPSNLDCWLECPTTLRSCEPGEGQPMTDPPRPPPFGATGRIYVLESHATAHHLLIEDPKWPVRLGLEFEAAVEREPGPIGRRLLPLKLELTAREAGSGREGTIDLLDPLHCARDQTILAKRAAVTLQLTQRGDALLVKPAATGTPPVAAARAAEAPSLAEVARACEVLRQHLEALK